SSQVLTRAHRDTGALRCAPAVTLDGLDPRADPGRLLGLGVDQRHVAHVHGGLLDLDAAGVHATVVAGLGVLGDPVDALDEHAVGLGVDLDHPALLATVAALGLGTAGDDLDQVVLLDLHPRHSDHLRRQRDDLHELLVAQLAAHRAEDAGAPGVTVVLEDDRGVLVETDVGTVGTPTFLAGAHDDRLHDVALLDVAAGDRVLDGGHDGVPDARVAATGATEHADAQDLLG